MFPHAQLMSRIINVPLMAHPRKLAVFWNGVMAGRMGGAVGVMEPPPIDAAVIDALRARPAPRGSQFVGAPPPAEDGSRRGEPFMFQDGVGIVTLTGSLINRGAWVGSYSGETSYEGFKHQMTRAARDSRVKSIIIDVESPGGEAVGMVEASEVVRRIAAEKPVHAVVNGMAASAGYGLIAGASRITTTPTGLAGSIGVAMLHLDQSRMLEENGVVPTLIFAGDHKVDANPVEPLSESVRADLQAEVNRFYELFLSTVSAGRGRRTPVSAARETQARTYIGQDAVAARLADDVGSFEDVFSELSRKARRSGGSAATGRKAQQMTVRTFKAGEISDDNTEVVLASDHAAELAVQSTVAAQLSTEETEAATAAGAAAERERITALLSNPACKGRETYAIKLAARMPTASAEDIAELVAEAGPAAAAPAPTIEQRAAGTNANQVSGDVDAAPKAADSKAGWNAAVNRANESVVSLKQQRR